MSNTKYPGPYLPPPTSGSNPPPQGHHFIPQGYPGYQGPDNIIHRGQTMEGGGVGQSLYGNGPNIEIGMDLPLVSILLYDPLFPKLFTLVTWPPVTWPWLCLQLRHHRVPGQQRLQELHHQHGQRPRVIHQHQQHHQAYKHLWTPAQVHLTWSCHHNLPDAPQTLQCLLLPVLCVLLPGLQQAVTSLQQLKHTRKVGISQLRHVRQ